MSSISRADELNSSLLPKGLRKLIFLRYKAFLRRLVFGNAKRKLFTFLGFGLMGVYLFSRVLQRGKGPAFEPENVRTWLPVFLIGFTVMNIFIRSRRDPVIFQPAELDLAVPGPYSRRQLVLYQILYQVGPLILLGLWMGLFIRTGGAYLCSALGIILLFFAINLLSGIVNSLMGLLNSISRFIVPIALTVIAGAIVLAVLLAPPFHAGSTPQEWIQWAKTVRHERVVDLLCIPFRPYSETLAGSSLLEALPWAFMAVLMDIGLMAAFILADRGEVETLVIKSQQHLAKIERARKPGFANPEKAAARQIPMLPRMGGAGVLLWRQLVTMYRALGPVPLGVIVLVILSSSIYIGHTISSEAEHSEGAIVFMISVGAASCFFLSMLVRSDFRADLDHMPTLKSLPIKSTAIVTGQLLAPILVTIAVQMLAFAGLSIGALKPLYAVYGLLICLAFAPCNIILVAIENIMFLLAPTRFMKSSMQGGLDPAQFGRTVIITVGKFLATAGAVAFVLLPAWAIQHFVGWAPGIIAGLILVSGMVYALVLGCTLAFESFNVTDDQPA